MKAKTGSGGWGRWGGRLLVALALASSCGKDKTTALDIKLQVTGALDQVRIDAVALGGSPISLTAESTLLFPTRARALKTDDVLTLWFPDDADKKTVVVTATGRLCGRDATAPATTAGPTALARGQTIETTLALMNDGTTCSTTDGGAGGTSGSGGAAAGTGGGTAGTGGIAGTAGAGGSAGGAGGGGAGGGGAGGGGTDGGAGTTGAAGSSGMGGRGGTTGTAGSSGAAGSGGTTGAAGAGGKGGGSGTTGTAGTGAACATAPASASAQLGSLMPGVPTTSCGYPIVGTTVPYLLTGSDFWAQSNAVALANLANCGRCVELVRTMTDGQKRNVVVTLVGGCPDAACQATPTPRFQLSGPAYGVVAPLGENFIPLGANETLTYSFVPCPVQANQPILANMKIAGGAATSVLFVQHRYGIKAVTVENITTAQQFPMTRSNDAYWLPPTGIGLGSSRFHLTDVNNAAVTTSTLPLQNNPPFSPAGTQFPVCPSP